MVNLRICHLTCKERLPVCRASHGNHWHVVANPFDVVKVRKQCEPGSDCPTEPPGMVQIARDEGFGALYSGLGPNMTRGATVTSVEMATFDTIKVGARSVHLTTALFPGQGRVANCSLALFSRAA